MLIVNLEMSHFDEVNLDFFKMKKLIHFSVFQDKNNPKWISHKLLVLQRPKIVTSSSHSNLTIIKGNIRCFEKSFRIENLAASNTRSGASIKLHYDTIDYKMA